MSHRAWLILSTAHIYSPATVYTLQWLCTGRLLCAHAVDESTKAQRAEWSAHSPTAKKGQAYGVGLPHSYLGPGLPGLCPIVTPYLSPDPCTFLGASSSSSSEPSSWLASFMAVSRTPARLCWVGSAFSKP